VVRPEPDAGMNHTVKYDPRATDITTYTVSAARLTASQAGGSERFSAPKGGQALAFPLTHPWASGC